MIAKALTEMLIHLQWKTVAIIGTGKFSFLFIVIVMIIIVNIEKYDNIWKNINEYKKKIYYVSDREPWMSLERVLLNSLQNTGAVVRRRAILPHQASFEQIRKILRSVYNVSRKGEFLLFFYLIFFFKIDYN